MGFATKQEELQDIEVRIAEKTAELVRVTGKVNEANELADKIVLTHTDADKAQALLDETVKQLESKKKERDAAADEFQQEVKAVQTMRATKDSLALVIEQDTKIATELRASIISLSNERDQLAQELKKAQVENSSAIKDLDITLEKKNHELDLAKSTVASLEVKTDEQQKMLESLEASVVAAEQHLEEITKVVAEKETEIARLDNIINEKNVRVRDLDKVITEEEDRLAKITADQDATFKARENELVKREGEASFKEKWLGDKANELKRVKGELEQFYGRTLSSISI